MIRTTSQAPESSNTPNLPPAAPRPLDPNVAQYQDIIDLPRPISKTHPPLDLSARAAQFSPYAALSGHQEDIAREEAAAEAVDTLVEP